MRSVKHSDEYSSDQNKKQVKLMVKKIIVRLLVLIVLLIGIAVGMFLYFYSLMDTSENYAYNSYTSNKDVSSNVVLPEKNIIYDKDIVNIMIIGTDERSTNFDYNAHADTIMLVSINNKSGDIKLVSLERGMTVKIPGRKDDLLTNTFRYGGSHLLLDTVSTHFNVHVDKYVRINMLVLQILIDEIGGVDVNLTEEEAYGLNTKNLNTWPLDREVSAGLNHFNGYEALQYARLRWIDDDFHRIQRQRNIIDAIQLKVESMSIFQLTEVAATCLPYVQTNLSSLDFVKLIVNVPTVLESDFEQITLPKSGTHKNLKNIDFKANSKILREFLYE